MSQLPWGWGSGPGRAVGEIRGCPNKLQCRRISPWAAAPCSLEFSFFKPSDEVEGMAWLESVAKEILHFCTSLKPVLVEFHSSPQFWSRVVLFSGECWEFFPSSEENPSTMEGFNDNHV